MTYGYDPGAKLTSAHVYMQGAGATSSPPSCRRKRAGCRGRRCAWTRRTRRGTRWATPPTAWRTDARFPALVTALETPNGLGTRAAYDARGNVDTTVVENPLGDGRNAVTRYTYGNAAWPDAIPAEVDTFAYDGAGNLVLADNPYARIRRGSARIGGFSA